MLRAARPAPLLGVLVGEAALFAMAVAWRELTVPGALLGLAACGAAAAYVLDEDAAVVADATPMSRPRRATWRTSLLVLPVAIAVIGLVGLDRDDPAGHWLRLTPTVLGVTALGLALSAAMRRAGHAQPGDLAAAIVAASVLFVVAANPLRQWVPVLPLGDLPHPGRSQLIWSAVAVVSALGAVCCVRDPVRTRHS